MMVIIVYKFRQILGRTHFSDLFNKIIIRYKKKKYGHSMNVIRQTACMVVNPITDKTFAALLNCPPTGPASDLIKAPASDAQEYQPPLVSLFSTYRG